MVAAAGAAGRVIVANFPRIPWNALGIGALGGAYVGGQADDAAEGFSQSVNTVGLLTALGIGAAAVYLFNKKGK